MYNEKKLPLMTSDLKNHLLAFNKSNAKDIHNVLKANTHFIISLIQMKTGLIVHCIQYSDNMKQEI